MKYGSIETIRNERAAETSDLKTGLDLDSLLLVHSVSYFYMCRDALNAKHRDSAFDPRHYVLGLYVSVPNHSGYAFNEVWSR